MSKTYVGTHSWRILNSETVVTRFASVINQFLSKRLLQKQVRCTKSEGIYLPIHAGNLSENVNVLNFLPVKKPVLIWANKNALYNKITMMANLLWLGCNE